MTLRQLVRAVGFGVLMFGLVWVSLAVTFFVAGVGHNAVVIEDGHRVAHFGWPFRFATADMEDPGAFPYAAMSADGKVALGSDPAWNPWEIPTEFDDLQLRRSWAANFSVLASLSLMLWLLVAARRRARGRPLRPSARPSG